MTGVADTTNADTPNLAHRLDVLGWGIFFLMTGVLMLFPSLPEGIWLVGLGVLLLGLAAVRVALGLAFGMLFFAAFLVGIAAPAWWLGYLALLARPGGAGSGADVEWYPPGRLVLWAAALGAK